MLDVYVIMYVMARIKKCLSTCESGREESSLESVAVMVDNCVCCELILIVGYRSVCITLSNDDTCIRAALASVWNH